MEPELELSLVVRAILDMMLIMLTMLFEIKAEFELMPAMLDVTILLRTLILFELSTISSEKDDTLLFKVVNSI